MVKISIRRCRWVAHHPPATTEYVTNRRHLNFLTLLPKVDLFSVGVDGGPTSVRRQHEDLTPLSI